MNVQRILLGGWIAAIAILLQTQIAAAENDAQSSDLPRYKLQVGQELIFRGQSQFQYEGGAHGTQDNWKIWVVRENPDGSWRLIVRYGNKFGSAREARRVVNSEQGTIAKLLDLFKTKPAPVTPPDSAAEEEAQTQDLPDIVFGDDESVTFAWCDFSPDGRIVENDSFGFRMRLASLLPRLPASAEEARQGWSTHSERMDDTLRYKFANDAPEGVRNIEYVLESTMSEIYGSENTGVIAFNLARGLPESIESKNTQTYGFNGHGTGKTTFVEAKSHPADWMATFIKDVDRYFAAKAEYDAHTSDRNLSPSELKPVLETGLAQLKAAGETIELPELKTLIDEQITNAQQSMEYNLEEAAARLAVLGQPSEDWSTTDLAGQPHALSDYRGKVVVMDFWYRGCGWCIRAMPQVKEVADHFEGQPVAVLGMNTDRNDEDAQFVIDKMKLAYPNLKATGLPEKYHVRGFPTLVILDQEGVIRDVHVGYSPTLKKDVVESVEKLLK